MKIPVCLKVTSAVWQFKIKAITFYDNEVTLTFESRSEADRFIESFNRETWEGKQWTAARHTHYIVRLGIDLMA